MYKKCQQCGKWFTPAATTPYQKFCSARCCSRHHYQARPLKPKKVKQCEYCGKPFETNSFTAKYCPDCREAANTERHREICRRYYVAHRDELLEKQRENKRRWYIKQKLKVLRKEVTT